MASVQEFELPIEPIIIPGFELERRLNRGKNISIFLAVQKNLHRKAAIKMLTPEIDPEPAVNESILNEALIAAQLTHPHIVTIYDIGNYGNYNYFTMEYLSGGNLRQKIGQGMTVRDVLKLLKQIAGALDFAHSQGVIHCDINPDNILLDHHNNAILSDFAIARSLASSASVYSAHNPKSVSAYMSPEQVRGAEVTGCTDIYSLGVILFELITGRVPFEADESYGMLYKQLTEKVPQLDKRYYMFQSLLDKMLEKTPQQRVQNGAEIINAIERMERHLWANAIQQNKGNENKVLQGKHQQNMLQQNQSFHQKVQPDSEVKNRFYAPGTKILYDASLVIKLKDDHKNLMELFGKILQAVENVDFIHIKQHSGNFLNLFNAHVLLEYTKLYIFLEYVFSEADENRLLVHEFRREMNSIGKSVRGFFKKWNIESLNTNTLPLFKKSLSEIGDVLIKRIKTEEELLYEIYAQVPGLNK